MVKKDDIRILKSKRDLRNGLLSLIGKSAFDKITVNDICDASMINRMTFYKHYKDKYDLLDDCIKYTLDGIYKTNLSKNSIPDFMSNPAEFCGHLTDVVIDEFNTKHELVAALVSEDNTYVVSLLHNSIRNAIELMLNEISKTHTLNYSIEILSAFITGGCANLLYRWILTPDLMSKDQFKSEVRKLTENILSSGFFFQSFVK